MRVGSLLLMLMVLAPAIAFADCVEGTRPAKPQEKAFYEKTSAALHAVIPPAPEGCRLSNASKAGTMERLCGREAVGEFSVSATQTYFCVNKPTAPAPPPSAEAQKIKAELDQLSRLPADVSKQKGDLMNQAGQKRKAALQAQKEGKPEDYKKLWAESQALYAEADKVTDAHWKSVQPRRKELEERLKAMTPAREPESGDIILDIVVNEQHQKEARPDEEMIVIGPSGKVGPSLKVKNIRVRVSGPLKNRREQVMQLVDRSKLEALLGR